MRYYQKNYNLNNYQTVVFINLCLKANSIIGIHKVALKVFLFFYKRKSLIYMPGGCS